MAELDPLLVELTQVRERRGLGVREVARLMGIGHMPGKISEWEMGTHIPQIHNVRRWANALGFDLALVSLPRVPANTTPQAPDLMAALKASLEDARAARAEREAADDA